MTIGWAYFFGGRAILANNSSDSKGMQACLTLTSDHEHPLGYGVMKNMIPMHCEFLKPPFTTGKHELCN